MPSASRRGEAGVVLLLVVFMAAVMLIAALASLPRIVMQGRRQQESELAWRGGQYVRAIRLYYRKYGHFPLSVEDFSKNPGNVHYLRKVYKDPINTTDGSWRYIYVGPGGQLIGSLTRTMPLGMIPLSPGTPGAPGTSTNTGQSSFFGSGPLGSPQSGTAQSGTGLAGAGQPGANTTAQAQPPNQTPGQPVIGDASLANPDDPTQTSLPPAPEAPKQAIQGATVTENTVFGGQLVGVGSKIDRKSIRFYKGYGKYREWEFIWDPTEGIAPGGGMIPQTTGTPSSLLPGGTAPIGAQPIFTPPVVTPPANPNNPPQ